VGNLKSSNCSLQGDRTLDHTSEDLCTEVTYRSSGSCLSIEIAYSSDSLLMNTPTAVAAATADPPLPNLLTRILPASPAVQARGNLNLGIMANISIAVAAGCF
jgi:hypothetical protein